MVLRVTFIDRFHCTTKGHLLALTGSDMITYLPTYVHATKSSSISFVLASMGFALFAGITLDLSKSLHNQGILEQEHITLTHNPPPDSGIVEPGSPARTEGASTSSGSFTNSEVCTLYLCIYDTHTQVGMAHQASRLFLQLCCFPLCIL